MYKPSSNQCGNAVSNLPGSGNFELSDVVKFYIKQRKPFKYQIEQLQESYKPCMCIDRKLMSVNQVVNCPKHNYTKRLK